MKLFSQGRFRQNGLHVSDIAKIYDAGLFYIRHNFENGAFSGILILTLITILHFDSWSESC